MKKKIKMMLLLMMMTAACVSVNSCSDDDYGYYKVEKSLFGEWETDPIESTESNGIVLYHVDIIPSDKHSVSPYRMIVKRKNGQWYLLKLGSMGHRNDDPDNVLVFSDSRSNYGSFDLTVNWLDKEKTRIILYKGMVFHKKSNTSCYDKDYVKDL